VDRSNESIARSSRAYSVLKIAKGAGIHTTRPHLTKKICGSIGNTTLHSLPGLYLLAISNAPSMLSASNATLNLAALLLTSMAIFIIFVFFRMDPLRSSVWLGVKQVRLPDGYPFVGHVAIFFGLTQSDLPRSLIRRSSSS
jgi:hypothetical protein